MTSLDGTTLVVALAVAQRGLVRELKRLVGQVRRGEWPKRGSRRRHVVVSTSGPLPARCRLES